MTSTTAEKQAAGGTASEAGTLHALQAPSSFHGPMLAPQHL